MSNRNFRKNVSTIVGKSIINDDMTIYYNIIRMYTYCTMCYSCCHWHYA